MLGVTHTAAMVFLVKLDWPSAYRRPPSMRWVTDYVEDESTLVGWDLAAHIRAIFEEKGYTEFSAAQVMRAMFRGRRLCSHVRACQAFLSHVQVELVGTAMKAMRMAARSLRVFEPSLFVDYFTLKQCQDDFKMGRIRSVIGTIGHTLMLLDPVMHVKEPSCKPDLSKRIWCLYEVYCTISQSKELQGMVSLSGLLASNAYGSVQDIDDVAEALSRKREDKVKILQAIEQEIGIDEINGQLRDAFSLAHRQVVERVVGFFAECGILLGQPLAAVMFRYTEFGNVSMQALSLLGVMFSNVLGVFSSKLVNIGPCTISKVYFASGRRRAAMSVLSACLCHAFLLTQALHGHALALGLYILFDIWIALFTLVMTLALKEPLAVAESPRLFKMGRFSLVLRPRGWRWCLFNSLIGAVCSGAGTMWLAARGYNFMVPVLGLVLLSPTVLCMMLFRCFSRPIATLHS